MHCQGMARRQAVRGSKEGGGGGGGSGKAPVVEGGLGEGSRGAGGGKDANLSGSSAQTLS